jgi:hypothetical protein
MEFPGPYCLLRKKKNVILFEWWNCHLVRWNRSHWKPYECSCPMLLDGMKNMDLGKVR